VTARGGEPPPAGARLEQKTTSNSEMQNFSIKHHVGMGQNPIPLVNIKIAGKWMFIPLKMYV